MNLAFVCLNADPNDSVHATTVRWIEVLAGRPEVDRVIVLALDDGPFRPPPNVIVRTFRGRGRAATLRRFYTEAFWAVRGGVDAFFVYQGGPYAALLWPFRILWRIPIYYWKAHPEISRWTRLSALWAATKVFTASPASFPLPTARRVVVGHGIDVTQFAPVPDETPRLDLVTVGRIAPVKHIDAMLDALAQCRVRFGSAPRLDIYGPTEAHDAEYRLALDRLTADRGLTDQVTFHGPIRQADVPRVLAGYRLFLNFSSTALDKAVLEAMACGLIVLSTNPAVAEILPPALRPRLIVAHGDPDAQAEAINRLLHLTAEEYAALSTVMRDVVVRDHNVEVLFARVIGEMESARRRSAHRHADG